MKDALLLEVMQPAQAGYDEAVWHDLFTDWKSRLSPDFVGLVQVSFVSSVVMSELYNEAFGESRPTDVLSLRHTPLPGGEQIVGEIVICPAVARKAALRLKTDIGTELATLFVHGLLHLSGMEHDEADERDRFHKLTRDIMASHSLEAVSLW